MIAQIAESCKKVAVAAGTTADAIAARNRRSTEEGGCPLDVPGQLPLQNID